MINGLKKLLFCLVATIFMGHAAHADDDKNGIVVSGKFMNCTAADSVRFYEYDGIAFRQIAQGAWTKKGDTSVFSFTLPKKLVRGIYFIGTDRNNIRSFILGNERQASEKNIVFAGECTQFNRSSISGSPYNTRFEQLMQQMAQINQQGMQVIGEFRAANGDTVKLNKAIFALRALDKQKLSTLDSTNKYDSFMQKTAALRTYISWYWDKKGYTDEIQYFGNEFFQLADFKDVTWLERMPLLADAFREFTQNVSQIGMDGERQRAFIEKQLARIAPNTRAYKTALSGVLQGYIDKDPTNFVYFADKWLKLYRKENKDIVPSIEQRVASLRSQIIGGAAPEIKMATPDGGTYALSQMKGKIVLIDFWASWCGPCRRSMPEVKGIYGKYKDRGFEILGVSLDKDNAAWLAAIKADNLPWKHVSDLKFWQSEAAQTYGVTSIPHTVLVDKNGNIAARNLQGAALEQKIEELLAK